MLRLFKLRYPTFLYNTLTKFLDVFFAFFYANSKFIIRSHNSDHKTLKYYVPNILIINIVIYNFPFGEKELWVPLFFLNYSFI